MRTITATLARRLAIARQRLAGPYPEDSAEQMMEVIRDIGCLQLDPISVVARSHLLVLWSRLGNYNPAHLDRLLWQERRLFEYWAHAASIVLTEEYPVHRYLMQEYARGETGWERRVHDWVIQNQAMHDEILARIEQEGALNIGDFADTEHRPSHWNSSGWNNGRNIGRMLDYLWTSGRIMVARRSGLQKFWDLSERCLPEWTPRDEWSQEEIVRYAVQRSMRALGVARARDINFHYTRGRYPGLQQTLKELESTGQIEPVQIRDDGHELPGKWYIHTDDLPLLERLEAGEWQPRTTLLSPFDNLICDRARSELLFNFRFRIEIYVPKEKRQYGYYVLPILHGDRLIGRVDPAMDRKQKRLAINALHLEPDAPQDAETVDAVAQATVELARFLGAREVVAAESIDPVWRNQLSRTL